MNIIKNIHTLIRVQMCVMVIIYQKVICVIEIITLGIYHNIQTQQ
jgi:hypothetical protein